MPTKVYRIGETSKGKLLTGKPRTVKAKAKPKKKKAVEKKIVVKAKSKRTTKKRHGVSLGKWKSLGGSSHKSEKKDEFEGFHW
jgi:hypothetical protein